MDILKKTKKLTKKFNKNETKKIYNCKKRRNTDVSINRRKHWIILELTKNYKKIK